MKQIFRATLCMLCVATAPSTYAGVVELGVGQWFDTTGTVVGPPSLDWDWRTVHPVLGTNTITSGVSPYAQSFPALGDARAQAFTSVTGLEFDFGDSYLLQIIVTNTAYASLAPGAAEGIFASAFAGVSWMSLGFDVLTPVVYVGAHDLRRAGDAIIYGSGTILQPGRYGADLRDFNNASARVTVAGHSAFDFATTTHSYRFQAVPVPAPAVLPLMLSGLLGIALVRRRRTRVSAEPGAQQ